jgi:putative membrane protein
MNHMDEHHGQNGGFPVEPVLITLFVTLTLVYLAAVAVTNRRYSKWPTPRIYCWCAGVWSAAFAITGPLADRAHADFIAHMAGHLLLGMLAPLLIALAAPVTMLLRLLPISSARRFSRLLSRRFFHYFRHPVVASLLNIGGLFALYTSGLYTAIHHNWIILTAVHLHVFLAGYLFTASIVYVDPVSRRFSFTYRAVVLILALAGHSILSKIIYASPPEGVSIEQAKTGAQLMYYGGDAAHLLLIAMFCFQWYKQAYPRNQRTGERAETTQLY